MSTTIPSPSMKHGPIQFPRMTSVPTIIPLKRQFVSATKLWQPRWVDLVPIRLTVTTIPSFTAAKHMRAFVRSILEIKSMQKLRRKTSRSKMLREWTRILPDVFNSVWALLWKQQTQTNWHLLFWHWAQLLQLDQNVSSWALDNSWKACIFFYLIIIQVESIYPICLFLFSSFMMVYFWQVLFPLLL